MHVRFVDKWCELYDSIWEEKGKKEAVDYLKSRLSDDNLLLVKQRFPSYAQEKKELEEHG